MKKLDFKKRKIHVRGPRVPQYIIRAIDKINEVAASLDKQQCKNTKVSK